MEQEAIRAAKEIVALVGFGLGNLMCRIHRGRIEKQDWNDQDRENASGTRVFLLGGSIGTLGYTGQLLPLIAQRRLKIVDPELARDVHIFRPDTDSAHAGAIGAYFLAVPRETRERVAEIAARICDRGKIPILPLLDVGGTKTNLVLAYVSRQGTPKLDILQSHRFPTPVGEPDSFYPRLASLIAFPLQAIAGSELFELIPVLAFGQPGKFDADGRIAPGTALDLGKTFPGVAPATLLGNALRAYVGDELETFCGNDGRAQFLGLCEANRSAAREEWLKIPDDSRPPRDEWLSLAGEKVAFLGLGTGLGAGFGQLNPDGDIQPFEMHNAFDIMANDEHERLPASAFIGEPLLDFPYSYGDLLSGKFFRRTMHRIDASRSPQDSIFLSCSSASALSPEQQRNLLARQDSLSPLSAILANDILAEEIVAAATEELVEGSREELESQLHSSLSIIAGELDTTLVNNVRPPNHKESRASQYSEVIDEVARVKRRGRRVQFIGVGKSHSIGQNLAYIYSNLGIPSADCELTGANSENLTNLREDDLVFLISNSGQAAELLQLIPYIERKHCLTVALTAAPHSPIARHCDYFINTFAGQNPQPIPEAPTTSTTSALAAGTAIGMVVSYLFDYDADDFFVDHPDLEFTVDFPDRGVSADKSFDRLAKVEDIFRRFATSIRALMEEPDFVRNMISLTKRILVSYKKGRTVFFTGAGASLRVAEKVAATLTSIGIDASSVNPAQLPHGDFRHVRRGDLLVIISFSGKTRHLLKIHDIAASKGADCAAITSDASSPLAQACRNGVCVIAGKGADDTDLVPVPDQKILSSFINLTVGDALSVILTHILKGTKMEFAEEGHHGGEFGRQRARLDKALLRDLGENLIEAIGSSAGVLNEINKNLSVKITSEHLRSYEKRRLVSTSGMPEVMIFGMGGIGLAYLAPLFHAQGKTTWFVERQTERIQLLQEINYQYTIQPGQAVSKIGRVSVIPATDDSLITVHALRVDTIVTAVGVPNYESLLKTFAAIVQLRYEFWIEEPLNIILSENFPVEEDPLARLRHRLRQMLGDPELKVYFDEHVGLVPAIDEAVVPEIDFATLRRGAPIVVEGDSAILFIDRRSWRSARRSGEPGLPELGDRVVFTDSFLPLHMRKLWVHNMAHSLIGYLGHYKGYTLIHDAVRDQAIEGVVRRAMKAIGHELYRRWSYRENQMSLDDYIAWRWERYDNQELRDTVARVCRDPLRKLGLNDRLLGPINYIRKYAAKSSADTAIVDILTGVVAAMHYAVDHAANELIAYGKLRRQVLDDLVSIDSALLDAAERQFEQLTNWQPGGRPTV